MRWIGKVKDVLSETAKDEIREFFAIRALVHNAFYIAVFLTRFHLIHRIERIMYIMLFIKN